MKIAYVYDAVYPWIKGGAEKRVYELSTRLAKRGHEVHCFGIKWWEGGNTIQKDGVYLHGICSPRSLYSRDRRSIREATAFALKVLSSLRGDYDVVDCQQFPIIPCFSARLATMTGRSDLFITWLEVWGDYWYDYLGKVGVLGKAIEAVVPRLTDNNIAISERTKRQLLELGASSVQVVPPGIDIEKISDISASDTESDIIYVGRLITHKNVDILINALALVKRQFPEIKATIIGDGPDAGRLKGLAKSLGLEENIEFTGFLENYDQALALMKASRVFVMPSTREGFGLAAIEAFACGLPVITINHEMNAVCDLVTDESGVICNLSCQELSAAIISILNKRKSHISSKCIDLAKGYDWEEICGRIESVYKK
jgi:glycosyltransferase involved in cell wall biosynthesis